MHSILLATDLGSNSDRALERALKLSKESGACLHILHVLPDDKINPVREEQEESTKRLIKAYTDEYKDSDNSNIVIKTVRGKKPHLEITQYASDQDVDLIVMGTHGASKFRDLFLGTTVERALVESSVPVLMVKSKPVGSYKNVLCGIDFAPASKKAFRAATTITPTAVFEIIYAYQNTVMPLNALLIENVGAYSLNEEEREERMVKFINEETEIYKKHNSAALPIKLQYHFLNSDPYRALIEEAEKRNPDLICVGAHSEPLSKIGPVTNSLMDDPPCDLLISGANQ